MKFEKDYIRFIEEIISKGCTRKSTWEVAPRRMWHLSNWGVHYPNKLGKVWVVFDLSADYKSRCIDRKVVSGPDLTNQS